MKFKVIYADPPWQYRNNNHTTMFRGTARHHYTTCAVKDIASWDVSRIAEDDSLLFMWATFPKLPEALQVIEGWGFKFITAPFVWAKTYKNGTPFCGVGFWTRSGAEVVLLGKKGKGVPRQSKAVRQLFHHPVTKHSAKPPGIRDKITELVGDIQPRIELFARGDAPEGWCFTGLESDGRLLTEAIDYYGTL
jgi:site-specific DNA-methyltransferase (adenine-specific)